MKNYRKPNVLVTKMLKAMLLAVMGTLALSAIADDKHSYAISDQLYIGYNAGSAPPGTFIVRNPDQWENIWTQSTGTPPPHDLKAGQTGIMIVNPRANILLTIVKGGTESAVVLTCQYHAMLPGIPSTHRNWTAAIIHNLASIEGCP